MTVRQKHQVKIAEPTEDKETPGPVLLVKTEAGSVTWSDKVKAYYKGIIAVITSILVVLNTLTPVFNFLPGQDKQYITVGIAVIGGLLAFFKDNEHWVDAL